MVIALNGRLQIDPIKGLSRIEVNTKPFLGREVTSWLWSMIFPAWMYITRKSLQWTVQERVLILFDFIWQMRIVKRYELSLIICIIKRLSESYLIKLNITINSSWNTELLHIDFIVQVAYISFKASVYKDKHRTKLAKNEFHPELRQLVNEISFIVREFASSFHIGLHERITKWIDLSICIVIWWHVFQFYFKIFGFKLSVKELYENLT